MCITPTSSLPIFNGFWGGFDYPKQKPTPLNEVPTSVDVVTLAFGSPVANNGLSTGYLCKNYTADVIKGWVKELQARGQKVLLSIMDTPTHHWGDMDLPMFITNAVTVIRDEWGLDGVDIDSESTNATGADFATLVNGFRGALGPNALITYDSYLFSDDDQTVFKTAGQSLSWVNLMAYFDQYDSMIDLFGTYAAVLGPNRVTIGVKPGKEGRNQSTPLSEVRKLAVFQPNTGRKGGMMLYTLTMDMPFYTGQPIWSYVDTIVTGLGGASAASAPRGGTAPADGAVTPSRSVTPARGSARSFSPSAPPSMGPHAFYMPPLPKTARTTQSDVSNSYLLTNRTDPTYWSPIPEHEVENIKPIPSGALWWYMSTDGVNDPTASDYQPQSSNPSSAPPSTFLQAITNQLSQQSSPQLTVFVHGLANEFTDAINTTATLGANLAAQGYEGLVIGFDWPSYGYLASLDYYASGYRDAATSGTIRDNINGSTTAFGYMVDFLQNLRSSVDGLTLNLVCHSEGNFMTMLGMAAMSSIYVDQVLMLAADVNNGIFIDDGGPSAGQGLRIASLSSRVTVYYTNNDDTLAGSQALYQPSGYHNPVYGGRLGQTGPAYNQGTQDNRMCSVDCSMVINEQSIANNPNITSLHSSYFFIEQVLQDIAATLNGTSASGVANRTAGKNPNDYAMVPSS